MIQMHSDIQDRQRLLELANSRVRVRVQQYVLKLHMHFLLKSPRPQAYSHSCIMNSVGRYRT
jgi:hypothetical protein